MLEIQSVLTIHTSLNTPATNMTPSNVQYLTYNLTDEFDSIDNFTLNATSKSYRADVESLPDSLKFSDDSLRGVIVYSMLFLFASVGNVSAFISLFKSRHRKSRLNLMLTHLVLADLIVTFIMIPFEIFWKITVRWILGDVACKLLLFLRAFGLYLSSNVLICISIDRYFAVMHPLKVTAARRRGKYMLAIAWGLSVVYAFPQSIFFHVKSHPQYPTFKQCVTYGSFSNETHEAIYNVTGVICMYFLPLFVIIVSYSSILITLWKRSKEHLNDNTRDSRHVHLRRSGNANVERARNRTLVMTAIIVAVFVVCWTPYVIMTLWYAFDRETASQVDIRVQDGLFMMAVSNSCMNPIVYGSYATNFRKKIIHVVHNFFSATKKSRHASQDVTGQRMI